MAYEWNLTGNLLWQLRRFREAEKALLAGERRLGKPDIIMSSNLHLTYFDLGDFDKVISTLERFPERFYPHWWFRSLGTLYFYYKNDKEKALDYYSKELGIEWFEGMDPDYYWQASILISIVHRKSGNPSMSWEALKNLNAMYKIIALHRLGRIADLNNAVAEASSAIENEPWSHYYIAVTFAQIDEPEKAMQHLVRAENAGWEPAHAEWLFGTVKDPLLDPLRHLPEFQEWEKRWLPPYKDYSHD
jgi:tetratricopeptide (TPR) repeat protein